MKVAGNELTLDVYDFKPCMKANIKAALEDEGYRCTVKHGVIVAKREGLDIPHDCYPSLDNYFSDAAKIVFEANRDCDCDDCNRKNCDQPDVCSIDGYARSVVVEEFQMDDTEYDEDEHDSGGYIGHDSGESDECDDGDFDVSKLLGDD
jgi:hypothetical protein